MNTPRTSGGAMLIAVSVFAASAFGALFPSAREQASRDSWARMWADAHNQHRDFILVFNQHIAEARNRFWATYPDKPGSAEASVKFSDLLRQKDVYLMSVAVGGVFANLGGVGVQLDGGIRRNAQPEWDDLVAAAKERGSIFRGAGNMMDVFGNMTNAVNLQGTLYNKYAWERDWWEYDNAKRIPVRWEKPETYGIYLYYRFKLLPEDVATSSHNKMVEMFGKQLVHDAAKKVMAAPKGENGRLIVTVKPAIKVGPSGVINKEVSVAEQTFTALTNPRAFETHRTSTQIPDNTVPLPDAVIGVFGNPLTAFELLVTKDDDRRYLLFYLSEGGKWEQAELRYRQLVLAFGEKDVLETARVVRTATKRQTDVGVMDPEAIGARRGQPFCAFEDILARKNPRGYVRSALISKEKLDSPAALDSAYQKLVSQTNESDVLATARKRAEGRPRLNGPNLMLENELDAIIHELNNPPPPEPPTGPLVDYPEYLGWKGFSADAKVSYARRTWQMQRVDRRSPERLGPGPVNYNYAYQVQSVDNKQALLWFTETNYDKYGRKGVPQDSEVGYPAKIAYPLGKTPPATTDATALTPNTNFRLGAEPTSAPVESGEEVIEIGGRRIATRWQSKSYRFRDDPSWPEEKDCTLVVKVWTSEAVPSGLVRRTEDKTWPPGPPSLVHPYGNRLVIETYLESFAGTRAGVAAPDPSRPVAPAYSPPNAPTPVAPKIAPTPRPSNMQPAPWATPNSPPPASPAVPRPAPATPQQPGVPPELTARLELSRRFNTLFNRASVAKTQLLSRERAPAGKAVPVPADVRTMRDTMDTHFKTALDAMNKSDVNQATQSLDAAEEKLVALETFLAR